MRTGANRTWRGGGRRTEHGESRVAFFFPSGPARRPEKGESCGGKFFSHSTERTRGRGWPRVAHAGRGAGAVVATYDRVASVQAAARGGAGPRAERAPKSRGSIKQHTWRCMISRFRYRVFSLDGEASEHGEGAEATPDKGIDISRKQLHCAPEAQWECELEEPRLFLLPKRHKITSAVCYRVLIDVYREWYRCRRR